MENIAFAWLITAIWIESWLISAIWIVGLFIYWIVRSNKRAQHDREAWERAEAAKKSFKRSQEEAARNRELEERRTQNLLSSGDIISKPSREFVKCSNGHRYRHEDFALNVNPGFGVLNDIWVAGCPICKSRSYSFENKAISGKYKPCGKCSYWYLRNKYQKCPLH